MSSSTFEHFTHPDHPLVLLKEDDVVDKYAKCYLCDKPASGSSPTYTCSRDDFYCESFYLHRSCAELPRLINHQKHNIHPLTLLRRSDHSTCVVCFNAVMKFAYACENCKFDVCMFCAFEKRMLHHEGHQDHTLTLTLMVRESYFKCDACCLSSKDSSYICTTCDFWIHKRCALSPFIIPNPTCHHHPLNLIYSIPDMHRYFRPNCCICSHRVYKNSWLYYCHRCTYFVHIECANSPPRRSIACDQLKVDIIDNEHDLVHFPLYNEESMFDLIVSQFSKIQVEFQDEGKNTMTTSTKENDPHIIEEHWSHYENHLLEQLQFIAGENDNDNNDNNDIKVLVCDGCIQPITISHPSYYACIPCGYFLHSFCATKLPLELPVGGSTVHPKHPLFLHSDRFYKFVRCGACKYSTNGFYYKCETCDIILDIRCAFLPTRIKHISHKHHFLVQNEVYGMALNSEDELVDDENDKFVYECHTCIDDFKINISSAFYPSRLKHKYDHHDITLRHPPFFYERAFYCEICEIWARTRMRRIIQVSIQSVIDY